MKNVYLRCPAARRSYEYHGLTNLHLLDVHSNRCTMVAHQDKAIAKGLASLTLT